MESLALFFSSSGRIRPKPFALGIALVYGLSFFSQMLLSPPVLARASVAPFAILQGLLTWCWFALHAKRLRDADRSIGTAVAIAILYALAMILLMLIIVPLSGPGQGEGGGANLASFFVVLMLFAALTGQMNLDFFFYLALAILIVMLTPILIALLFSIRAGLRPSVRPVP